MILASSGAAISAKGMQKQTGCYSWLLGFNPLFSAEKAKQRNCSSIVCYGSPSQLPAIGMSPETPRPKTISAKPMVLELRSMNVPLR